MRNTVREGPREREWERETVKERERDRHTLIERYSDRERKKKERDSEGLVP